MEWKFSEEQFAYAEALRDWLEDAAPVETVRAWQAVGDSADFEAQFARDWAGVGLAEELGGQGGGLVELAQTAEELARAAAPSAAWMSTVLAAPLLAGRADLVEALAGATLALLVPSEAIPGSTPPLAMDAAGRITGTVPRVLAGDTAAHFVVVVQELGAPSLRLVDAGSAGVAVSSRRLLDRSRSVADVVLDGAASEPLAVEAAVGLEALAQRAAVLTAADALGASGRMLELAVEYSKQRKQFGVAIGSFQAVKHAAATIVVAVEAARSVVYFAAASVESGQPESALHAAAAKAQVTKEAVKSADSALTMHGAIGYTWEHHLHLFYKRVKLDEQLNGSPTAWNLLLADRLELVGESTRLLV
ncbi:acyl-CoA dehydrogenase family protein [Arthrobacter sp.]|uniref:acyl-CoA dehydrogenase family protein n=1 Tax=Arthrobacter sp. TaxID=1667 RepID=UPI003399707B